MKRGCVILTVLLACLQGQSQINEKDTLVTSIASKKGSVQVQADVMPDYILLNWSRGPHEYISHFELYRSADGVAYHLVQQFHPQTFDAAERSFQYRDEAPLKGRNFYRLTSVDRHTGERRNVDLVADYKNDPRKIQPTLVSRGSQLNIQHYDGEEMRLWIYTSAGTPVVQNRIINSSVINLPEKLSRGLYIYQLIDKRQVVVANGKLSLP